MYASVIGVRPLENHKLILEFENTEQRIFDVAPLLSIGKFSELRDISIFNTVKIKFDTIEWSNQLDIDPEYLYEKSIKVEI
jgi:hypothetical protein